MNATTDKDLAFLATDFNATDAKGLSADPAKAIAFALDHLPAHEVADFMRDWRSGADLQPWLDALIEDQETVRGGQDAA